MAKKITKATSSKVAIRARRRKRVRSRLEGTAERPRLCVTKTNKRMTAQLIDDANGTTIMSAQTPAKKTANVSLATDLGKQIAASAIAKGIQYCVFDRAGNLYHGRIA